MSVTVLVIPHAGGMASAYYEFSKFADSYVDFNYVELAGRGARMGEHLYEKFEESVNDIYQNNIELFQQKNYVLFGHSMRSWLAYELYYKIKEEGQPLPMHLFFSGNVSPFAQRFLNYRDMSDEEFIEDILKKEQTSKEVFMNRELREIFLPILRADFKMLEEYRPKDDREPINCNISVLCGLRDPLLKNGVTEWEKLTTKECEITYFEGNHFYLFDNMPNIFDYIYRTVEMYNNI